MSIFDDITCLVWKTNPLFWQAYVAARAARASGAITNLDQCKDAARGVGAGATYFSGDLVGALSQNCAECACKTVFGDPAPVILFKDDNFGGDLQECDEGEYRADRGELDEVGNDQVSSLVVAPGWKVRIAQSEPEGGLGEVKDLEAGAYYSLRLQGLFTNDSVSYVKVYRA